MLIKSVAEKIASELDLEEADEDGTSIREFLQDYALDITRKGAGETAPVRYLFIDGSSIEVTRHGRRINLNVVSSTLADSPFYNGDL
jgi:hypothetical protein